MVAILDFQSEQFFFLFFIYQSPQSFLLRFELIGLSIQEKKRKIDFQDGHHGSQLGFPIRTFFFIFDLQVTPKLPTLVPVNWPFGSGEEANNRFSRWPPSWISDPNDFSFFDLQVTPMLSTKFRVNWPFGSGEEKNRFSRWPPWRHLGFLIGMILAIFYLQVTQMLPTKFLVNWPFGSGEDEKYGFSRWRLLRLPTKLLINWPRV